MNSHRPRLDDKELHILQKLVYHRLASFHGKEVTDEARDLYLLLQKLLNEKVGRPSKKEVSEDEINEILINWNELFRSERIKD